MRLKTNKNNKNDNLAENKILSFKEILKEYSSSTFLWKFF